MTPCRGISLRARCVLIAICFWVSAIAAILPQRSSGGTPFCAQTATSSESGAPVLRSEVNVQTVNLQVKDKQGNDVPGLAAQDFTVRENGQPQKIAFFDAGNGPVTVAVLVDSSSSMVRKGHLGSAQEIAARFMRVARPGDEIWAMDFTEWTGPFEQFTAAQLSNPGPVNVPESGGEGSAVYNAIATAICHLRDSKNPRQAIIVITDGVDEHSRISLDQLINLLRSQRAQLFLIGFTSRPEFHFPKDTEPEPKVTLVSGHDIDSPTVVFDRLAKEAGAQTFTPESESGLQDALKAVSTLLESEYTLAYYPPTASRKLRKIDVKVDRSGVRVLADRFVAANPDSANTVHFVEGTCTVSPELHRYPYESHVTNGAGGTVYRDDFSDHSSGWPEHPQSHYVAGGYELSTIELKSKDSARPLMETGMVSLGETTTLAGTYRENVIAAYGPSWRDFRASATMKAVPKPVVKEGPQLRFTKPVQGAAGIVFRMNQEGYYALLVRGVDKEKELSVELVARKFEGDSYAESALVPWTAIARDSPSETKLAVEDVRDQIIVFVNGQKVESARDDRFSEGYVGFTVSAPASATFGNFVVEDK